MHLVAEYLIKALRLEPHEEGGFFKVTYESEQQINIPGFNGTRRIGNAIYYLMTGDKVNPFHRLKSDEVWHYYSGGLLNLYSITPDGTLTKTSMSHDLGAGHVPQVVIKRGTWFGGELVDPNSYCLIGCTVSPGFDQEDFEWGKRDELLKQYPEHRSIIEKLGK